MGLIPQVKCGRCDRTYSGLRSRCPYCGAHRHKKGKRVSDGDNATWKLIIGILLIVVLIAAVIVILVTGGKDGGDEGGKNNPISTGDNNPDDQPGNNPSGTNPSGTGTQITVTGADGSAVTTLTLDVNGTAVLSAAVSPDTVTDAPVWASSDSAVATVTVDETGLRATVTGVAAGNAVVTVTVGDSKVDIPVTCGSAGPGPGDTSTQPPSTVASAIEVSSQYSKGNPITDNTLHVGEKVTYTAKVTPSTCTSPVTWSVSVDGALEILPQDETGIKVQIYCVSAAGYVTVTATVDGVSYDFRIQCRK